VEALEVVQHAEQVLALVRQLALVLPLETLTFSGTTLSFSSFAR